MRLKRTSKYLIHLAIILGIVISVYPARPSALLKRAMLRKRLLQLPSYLRPKRQLFREDIPHHRPLTGNTYYLHAGFPHPSRWHEGPQFIPPNPHPVTHHHLHEKPGLHDDLHNHNHNNHHHHNDEEHFEQLLNGAIPPHHAHLGGGHGRGPVPVQVINKTPQLVNIHSGIVHANGLSHIGGAIDNNLLGAPPPPQSPVDQANFDPLIPHPHPLEEDIGHIHGNKKPNIPKPHSEPDPFDDFGPHEGDDFEHPPSDLHHENHIDHIPPPPPPSHSISEVHHHHHNHDQKPHSERKPKTVIHYHPISVGNIINFNDDHKPGNGYGPPDHVPGIPLSQKDVLHAISQPFIKTPNKSVNGPPDFLEFKGAQYGPPNHTPGHPLGHVELQPMLPSYGPPVKEDPIPPYGPALPVIAHLHHQPPHGHGHHLPPHIHHHHHPPPPLKRHRGGRSRHHHHVHLHHFHHASSLAHAPHVPPPPQHHPHPVHVVHGHIPNKLISPLHSPSYGTHHPHPQAYHHQKSFWSL